MKTIFYSKLLKEKIETACQQRDWSVADLAKELTNILRGMEIIPRNSSVSTQTVYNYMAMVATPSFEYALALAAILNLNLECFIPEEGV